MSKKTERPEFITDKHLEYLDELCESGQTNMYGAALCLQKEFPFALVTLEEAKECFIYWVRTFGDKNR